METQTRSQESGKCEFKSWRNHGVLNFGGSELPHLQEKKKNAAPSFHFGVGIPGYGFSCTARPGLTAYTPPLALYFNLTSSSDVCPSHFSHLGRTGGISPHPTVKIESVSACKMAHSKCSLIVSCIVTTSISHWLL